MVSFCVALFHIITFEELVDLVLFPLIKGQEIFLSLSRFSLEEKMNFIKWYIFLKPRKRHFVDLFSHHVRDRH